MAYLTGENGYVFGGGGYWAIDRNGFWVFVRNPAPPPTAPALASDADTTLPTDTVKPTKVDCDSAKNARGVLITEIIKQLDSTSFEMTKLRDSVKNSNKESGFQILNDSANIYTDYVLRTSGQSLNVVIPSTYPGHNQIGSIHNHPDSGVNAPSPADFVNLIFSKKINKNYITNIVLAHDSTEWALVINDTNAINTFLSDTVNHSIFALIDTSGENKNGWSSKTINPNTGNTYYKEYLKYIKMLEKENYPATLIEAYAGIYMMNKHFNTGVSLLQRVGSSFKEISIYDKDSNGKEINKIKICN